MADIGEGLKFSSLLRIPRLMLLIVGADWLLWFVGVPLAFGLRYGDIAWFKLAGIGLLIVPIGIMAVFIRRLLLYFQVMFYWYLVGFATLVGAGLAIVLIATILLLPRSPFTIPNPHWALDLVPPAAEPPIGAALFILALVAVFFVGRLTGRRSKAASPNAAPPAANPITQIGHAQRQISQQLLQRQQRLNQPPKP